jgi:hypothetical protein
MATAAKHIVPDFTLQPSWFHRIAEYQGTFWEADMLISIRDEADRMGDGQAASAAQYALDTFMDGEPDYSDLDALFEAERPGERSDWRLSSMAHDLGMGE